MMGHKTIAKYKTENKLLSLYSNADNKEYNQVDNN